MFHTSTVSGWHVVQHSSRRRREVGRPVGRVVHLEDAPSARSASATGLHSGRADLSPLS